MTFVLALVKRSLARLAGVCAGVGILLAGLQIVIVLVAASQYEAQSFDLIAKLAPSFVQRQFGSAFPIFLSFPGLVTFGYFHPVVILMVSIFTAFVATELAADVEGGHVDLILARPLARHWLVTRSLLLVVILPLVLTTAMVSGTRIALELFAPQGAEWPSARVVGLMATHLLAIAIAFGTFALAVAAAVKRRISAVAASAILAVSMYLLDLLAGAWRPLAQLGLVSPFHYYPGPAVLSGTADSVRDFVVLGSMSLILTAIAYWRFTARDV